MNEEKFSALLSLAIVPQVVDIIVREEHMSDVEAINVFYQSETYALLEKEETKVWHYSATMIAQLFEDERSGNLVLPEVM